MFRLSPAVKRIMANPMMIIMVLLMEAVDCKANSFFPVSVTRKYPWFSSIMPAVTR